MALENPVRLREFEGSPRRMGVEQGRLFEPQVRWTRRVMSDAEAFRLMKPWFLPTSLFLWLGGRMAARSLTEPIRNRLPRQWERLAGIAEGSGAGLAFILMLNAMEIELGKVDYRMPGGCSALGVAPERSAEGEPVIVKNFDYPEFLQELYLARLSRPEGARPCLDVSATPFAGSHEGINDAGLAIAYNYGCVIDEPDEIVPITCYVQEALERCETVAQAVDLIAGSPRAGGALLMMADAGGDMCTLEVSNSRQCVRRPDNGVLINANHYLTDELKAVEAPHDAVYSAKTVKALRGTRVHQSSEARFDQVHRQTRELEKISLDQALAVFSSHDGAGQGSDFTVCRHGPFYSTTSSVVFLPARKQMRIMWGSPCRQRYTTFSL